MHQARSTLLLPPHLLHRRRQFGLQHHAVPMHDDHNPMDRRDDRDERAAVWIPYRHALDHECTRVPSVLHLHVPFRDRLRHIELSARSLHPRVTDTKGSRLTEMVSFRLHAADLVLAYVYGAEIGRDWGLWISCNVSNMPIRYTISLYLPARQILTSATSGLAASAVRMAIYIRLTESASTPSLSPSSTGSANTASQTDQVPQPMGTVSLSHTSQTSSSTVPDHTNADGACENFSPRHANGLLV